MRRLALFAAMVASLTAQQPPTASIEGTIFDDISNEPVRKAQVTLVSPSVQTSAITDALGRFAFRNLADGSYVLRAAREGFDEMRGIEFEDSLRPINLTPDQHVTGADLRLVPNGAISGHLADEDRIPSLEELEV